MDFRTLLRHAAARINGRLAWLTALLFALAACSDPGARAPEPVPLPAPVSRDVSFHDDIRPILESKCLSCHSCYDAPCQLKLETAEGLVRGGHAEEAYNGTRTRAQTPTRLGIDAEGEDAWRALGFHSVLEGGEDHRALLYNMVALGKQRPLPPNTRLPDNIELGITRQNSCEASEDFERYAKKHPQEGMPLAVTGLTNKEFSLIAGWLNQGAQVPDTSTDISGDEQAVIDEWEAFLNRDNKRAQLVSRWLFEHMFLAHLYFEDLHSDTAQDAAPRFFEMIRSATPPGEAIVPIATARPNDPPDGPVYYRLRPVSGSIVHKRHIVLPVGDAMMARIESLFFAEDWPMDTLPGYGYAERANPFVTFAAIPARARYQFMLDHAEYFTRTFIRGPVCRGQIATDVIRDHFWALFQDPEDDLFITDGAYYNLVAPLLGMPGQDDNLLAAGKHWHEYLKKRNTYQALRTDAYREAHPDGASVAHIWDGDGENTNALLSIFRHHDSATVERGLIGPVPQTIWWMDYPLFERTYYELVVNFNVFGNAAHQVQTRLYFDLIRNGSEYNFLRLLPPDVRRAERDDWYRGSGKLKTHVTYAPLDDKTPSAESFQSGAAKQELGVRLLEHFSDINVMAEDRLNRCNKDDCGRRDQPAWIMQTDLALSHLAAVRASHMPGIKHLPDVSFLRVTGEDGERTVYSLVRNRAHTNVAFMLGEERRYEPDRDYLVVYPGIMGSYPNFMFDVAANEVEQFSRHLGAAESEEDFRGVVAHWGVRRTHPDFWDILHDFTAWQAEHQPIQAGIFDINRFENL
ncbi:fatty acid cis/trans isomerase [Alcanivorax sp. JB21]|uniref:fatty acid cis/trans isomerase n=1 Tax=Alcanivorax limicola TaxID=2874102 RepID=UPI001CC0C375|nr:fatty acid cis/trans isomerase [Alcanivorax limicola]MBZ2188541.1 fatty acid cis/trans isomerase [Alcanivorax limicola]